MSKKRDYVANDNQCTSCYGNSDPYVEVTASSYIGSEYKQKMMTLVDTQNPTWNESLFSVIVNQDFVTITILTNLRFVIHCLRQKLFLY